ncbi:hypothetical protein Hgul01_04524 [Herpetosiphon gulosus]|uniref:Uncharacterized protein n=1 Tax=Herpetosiphon gulosus TaxID=1973496 RepID=A0ABP9X5M4_9CHLR
MRLAPCTVKTLRRSYTTRSMWISVGETAQNRSCWPYLNGIGLSPIMPLEGGARGIAVVNLINHDNECRTPEF